MGGVVNRAGDSTTGRESLLRAATCVAVRVVCLKGSRELCTRHVRETENLGWAQSSAMKLKIAPQSDLSSKLQSLEMAFMSS